MSTSLVQHFLHRFLLMLTLSVAYLKLPMGQCWLVMKGAVGESAVLPGRSDSIRVANVQWSKGGIIVQRYGGNITVYNKAYEGRLSLSEENGSLTINPLIKSDTGEYTFESLPPPWPLEKHVIQLNTYDRIVSVKMDSQVTYSPVNSTCAVTLSCTVNGSVVELSWSKDRKKIPDTEDKETLVVTPTAGETLYSCTASNPVSSQTASLVVSSCQTHIPQNTSTYVLAMTGALFLLVLVIMGRVLQVRATRKETKENPVYAEVNKQNIRERMIQDTCTRRASPSREIFTCYDVLRSTSDIASGQAAPLGDVSTCYAFLKSPSVPPSGISTIYQTVKFVHRGPTAAVTQGL